MLASSRPHPSQLRPAGHTQSAQEWEEAGLTQPYLSHILISSLFAPFMLLLEAMLGENTVLSPETPVFRQHAKTPHHGGDVHIHTEEPKRSFI